MTCDQPEIPFLLGRPSTPLHGMTLACAAVGVILPYSPLADLFDFTSLPLDLLGCSR